MSTAESGESVSIAVVIPVFNDWESVRLLLPKLDEHLEGSDASNELILVDDGSGESHYGLDGLTEPKTFRSIRVLALKRNLGHQRAITIGLAYAYAETDCDIVLVMDGDGEDRPEEAPLLIKACRDNELRSLIFARRSKRSEGVSFRFFYAVYKTLYRILTGSEIRFGNFSAVPRSVLKRLVVVSEVWNHYAGGALKARVPFIEIDTQRGKRLSGSTSMNFVSLVTHGLSAISVFGDRVGVRLLLGTIGLMAVSLGGILLVVLIRLVTDLAIPGWATYVVALLLIILMQAVSLSLFFIFIVLSNRDNASFLPERDYVNFIADVRTVFEKKWNLATSAMN